MVKYLLNLVLLNTIFCAGSDTSTPGLSAPGLSSSGSSAPFSSKSGPFSSKSGHFSFYPSKFCPSILRY